MPLITVTLQEGFGNRMSQYAFARAYAELHGCELQTTPWMGSHVFDINDPPITKELPTVTMESFETWDGRTDINLVGWGQHQKNLIYTRNQVREWFRFRPEILDALKNVPSYEVVAHLRWGDFVWCPGFVAITKESYLRACTQYGVDATKLRFISEEEPIVVPELETGDHHTRGTDPRITNLGFLPDFYAMMQAQILFRACSTFSFWAATLGNARRVFSPDLSGINYIDPGYREVPFVEGNHMPITMDTSCHSQLHLKGDMRNFESHSQAAQDTFVYELLVRPSQHRGTFLDIGCGEPLADNNTYALERMGWTGLLVDSDTVAVQRCRDQRTSTVLQVDATTFKVPETFKDVDYLSLDVDTANVEALHNLMLQGVRFRVATVLHNAYCYPNSFRWELRQMLWRNGYFLLCENVRFDGHSYEDWWVDLKRVPQAVAARMLCVDQEGKDIAPRAHHRFEGFNGQMYRMRDIAKLFAAINFKQVVETGTCNGETSGYLAEAYGMRVTTSEVDAGWVDTARIRLQGLPVDVWRLDSREMLKALVVEGKHAVTTFFYLDAHWGEDLPLAEELETIAGNWKRFVAVIDDFRVPDDQGYGYDDYGPGKVIGVELLRPVIKKHDLQLWIPNTPSALETGAKRGTAYICSSGMTEYLESLNLQLLETNTGLASALS